MQRVAELGERTDRRARSSESIKRRHACACVSPADRLAQSPRRAVTLLETIAEFSASTPASAARRRDEEKARAKERIFSFRDEFGQWDPERTSARNCGTCITPACTRARTCACSRSRTGPSWMCGSTSRANSWKLPLDLFCARSRQVIARKPNGLLVPLTRT